MTCCSFTDHQEVQVFERALSRSLALDFTVNRAALKIKLEAHTVWVSYLGRVLHQQKLACFQIRCVDREHTKYLGHNTVWVPQPMLAELL